MLFLENIWKSFHGTPALRGVNLSIGGGETHALIGSSGSGKTTLLRITLGLITSDQGHVRINDQPLSSFTPAEWARQIGYVPQEGGLFPHLTIMENITLPARLRGWTAAQCEERARVLSLLVDLEAPVLHRYPHELSGGQRQRGSIMRAAFMDPPVLLLDEPMGALDPLVRQSLQTELKSIFRKLKKTVVIVTHDLSEAVFLAQKLTLLHQGRVVQSGTYEEFVKKPQDPFVNLFVNAHRTLPDEGSL